MEENNKKIYRVVAEGKTVGRRVDVKEKEKPYPYLF